MPQSILKALTNLELEVLRKKFNLPFFKSEAYAQLLSSELSLR